MVNNKDHVVDFTVFKKTLVEKAAAQTIKKQWKSTMKMFYGELNWHKHNNFPETLTDH